MSDRILVENSFVESLIKNAAWDAARVSLKEGAVVEEVAVTCPLCESTIAEEITDKQLKAHLDQISEALDSIGEAKKAKLKEKAKKVKEMEDEEEEEEELEEFRGRVVPPEDMGFPPEKGEDEDEEDEDEDEEDVDEKSKKKESKVMKKVKELKASAKGK